MPPASRLGGPYRILRKGFDVKIRGMRKAIASITETDIKRN
jgi:hypothetical protein